MVFVMTDIRFIRVKIYLNVLETIVLNIVRRNLTLTQRIVVRANSSQNTSGNFVVRELCNGMIAFCRGIFALC